MRKLDDLYAEDTAMTREQAAELAAVRELEGLKVSALLTELEDEAMLRSMLGL